MCNEYRLARESDVSCPFNKRHGISKLCVCVFVFVSFPTSLCGVLVFGSASRPPPPARLLPSPPPVTTCAHTQLVHTPLLITPLVTPLLVHTQLVFTLLVHTQLVITFTLRGRRGTYGTGLALVARLVRHGAVTPRRFAWQARHFVTFAFTLCGRRGTW